MKFILTIAIITIAYCLYLIYTAWVFHAFIHGFALSVLIVEIVSLGLIAYSYYGE